MSTKAINRFFTATDKFIDKGFTALIIIGGVLVPLTVVLQVLLRYVFKVPLFGLEEFSRLIAVWVYFLGAILGTKWDAHVQGDVAGRLFSTTRARSMVTNTPRNAAATSRQISSAHSTAIMMA
jgi:TRAP-type C4-dicarboxylate transport system permease small subunit